MVSKAHDIAGITLGVEEIFWGVGGACRQASFATYGWCWPALCTSYSLGIGKRRWLGRVF